MVTLGRSATEPVSDLLAAFRLVVLGGARQTGKTTPIFVAAASLIELVYVAEKRSDNIDADTLSRLLTLIEEPPGSGW